MTHLDRKEKQSTHLGSWSRRGAKLGWKGRHFAVFLIATIGTLAFMESRAEWSDMHRWNRAIGDMSLVLVSLAIVIGPLSRLWNGVRQWIPWRREFGIYGVFLAAGHTLIILGGWIEWDFARLFGYQLHPLTGLYVMVQHGFALSNVIGIIALVYGIVLALASNNFSQRVLGGPAWKFLQQGTYVLWMLIVLHTAYFLFLHFQDFHRQTPEPNWAMWPFTVLVGTIACLQLAAFLKTWRMKKTRKEQGPLGADRPGYVP